MVSTPQRERSYLPCGCAPQDRAVGRDGLRSACGGGRLQAPRYLRSVSIRDREATTCRGSGRDAIGLALTFCPFILSP